MSFLQVAYERNYGCDKAITPRIVVGIEGASEITADDAVTSLDSPSI
ncbi:hypothetical protein Q9K01_15105 [Qipengyuania sp. DY56-A-20]|jgi:hypothetical protein|uniref:Uncharacterized protein n=1 Tax=Qipengyuania benthica TaxID=3067651 RepID=A0ABT9HDI1_9SPHN|nr:hypothetical protein [Qipengyuania sp. DY56-A-20]MDP4540955.1 hypothetical protein [Qipengyuania sp. DY56-A-20]